MRFPKSTKVQTVLFDKTLWTVSKAKKWLDDHGWKTPPADTTKDFHRFRQRPPFDFQKGTFRTIVFGAKSRGIKAVIAVPRAPTSNPSRYGDKTLKKGTYVRHIGGKEKWEIVKRTGLRYYSAKNANGKTTTLKIGEFEPFPPRRNSRKSKKPWVPGMLVDLADPISIDIEGGDELRFPLSGNFALGSNRAGSELWIVSRKGAKKVRATDQKGEALYEAFTGFEHDEIAKLIQVSPKRMTKIGRATNIVYRSDKFSSPGDTSDYIHAFRTYPIVSVDNVKRPSIVALRGGRIKVRKEGITG